MNAKKCSERISGGFHSYQCPKSGKIERDGRWYCGTHDPVRIKEKQQERDDRKRSERFRAHRSASEQREKDEAEQKRRSDLFPELLEHLEKLLGMFESEIHNEYDGTSALESRLAEADEARAAITKARGAA